MSLHEQSIPAVPEQTAAVAKKAFPKGSRYMTMRDELGVFYEDMDFAQLFAVRGRPAQTPWRLALVLVFQFVEGLSDEQATKAERRALAAQIGADGRTLLAHLCAPDSPSWLREIDAVRILHRVWLEQYAAVGDDEAMCWRKKSDQPSAAERIHTPYDPEARYSFFTIRLCRLPRP